MRNRRMYLEDVFQIVEISTKIFFITTILNIKINTSINIK